MKILVRNLARSTASETLQALFETVGTVNSCHIVMDKITGASKGFGFIDMPKPREAKAAIGVLNYKPLDGSKIRVKKVELPEQSPDTDND